ncbi:MAG TPA: DUF1634 domain-containing protein [Gammaproteobacteria bacterium]|nr:DUF1634 domain-containing protein [Gammaproteobacteria bacterium]
MSERLAAQRRLVTVWILRTSIGLSVLCIVAGLAVFLMKGADYQPHTPSGAITSILAYVWREAMGLHASAFLDAGVLVMLFTPLARLASGVIANVRIRDWLYVAIGVVVIGLVLTGMFAGQSGS